jgi:hypothetical protein
VRRHDSQIETMSNLPDELWLDIVNHLTWLDFGSIYRLRLACHRFAKLALPSICYRINLIADIRSLYRLLAISETPHMAEHVRTLAMSNRITPRLHTVEAFIKANEFWKTKHPERQILDISDYPRRHYYEFLSQQGRLHAFHLIHFDEELSNIIPRLPRLEEIYETELEYPVERPDWAFLKHFGVPAFSDSAYQIQDLFVQKPETQIFRSMRTIHLAWDLERYDSDNKLTEDIIFDRLENFELHIVGEVAPENPPSDLLRLIRATKDVKRLSLAFKGRLFGDDQFHHIWLSILSCEWTAIRTLQLGCMVCPESIIVPFILRHRETLKVLGLREMIFHTPGKIEPKGLQGSPVRVFWTLQHLLPHIEYCDIIGYFSNHDTECWHTNWVKDDGKIPAAVERALCHEAPLPFPDEIVNAVVPRSWMKLSPDHKQEKEKEKPLKRLLTRMRSLTTRSTSSKSDEDENPLLTLVLRDLQGDMHAILENEAGQRKESVDIEAVKGMFKKFSAPSWLYHDLALGQTLVEGEDGNGEGNENENGNGTGNDNGNGDGAGQGNGDENRDENEAQTEEGPRNENENVNGNGNGNGTETWITPDLDNGTENGADTVLPVQAQAQARVH